MSCMNTAPTLGVNRCGDASPALDMLGSVDPRRVGIALPVCRRLRALANDQSQGGALPVVLGHQFPRCAIRVGAASGHGCQRQPMGEVQTARVSGCQSAERVMV